MIKTIYMEVIQMNEKMYEIMRDGRGFIAALDQSGGSSAKTLVNIAQKRKCLI